MKQKFMRCMAVLLLALLLPTSAYAKSVQVYLGEKVTLPDELGGVADWTTENPAVARVEGGIVTGVGSGITKIIQSRGVYKAEHDVTVYNHSLSLANREMTVGEGTDATNTARLAGIPTNMTPPAIKWESDNKSVVTVEIKSPDQIDKNGTKTSVATLHGVSPGMAHVTVSVAEKDGKTHKKTVDCIVTVPGIVLGKTSLTLVEGNAELMTKTTYGIDPSTTLAWESDNLAVATIDSTGRVTAVAAGTANITIKSSDGLYSESCKITVESSEATVITAPNVQAGMTLKFAELIDELDDRSHEKLKSGLSYITNISVADEAGALFYGYISPSDHGSGVGTAQKFYHNSTVSDQLHIDRVVFEPKTGFFGTATISYRGFNEKGETFSGKITVKVDRADGIVYTIAKGETVTMETAKFNDFCVAQNGRSLKSVTFSLPDESRGTLYYNYVDATHYESKVTASREYLRTGIPNIASVTFVPNANFSGEVILRYTGCDTSNVKHEGKVTVHVLAGDDEGIIRLRTEEDTAVTLSSADFNAASRTETGENLSYIRFDKLPEKDVGVFYYNYVSAANYGSAASTSARYYRSSTPALSSVAFVPAAGYVGSFDLPYTGCDINGKTFTGTLRVTVSAERGVVHYETEIRTPVTFDAADLNEVCRDFTGENLSRIRFTLPSAAKGTLYYQYDPAAETGTPVSATAYYYRNAAPLISSVAFVPATGSVGSVEIPYVGYDINNATYTGKIVVTVGSGEADVAYTTSSATPVTFLSADFNEVCLARHGCSLRYVNFDIPASSQGKLYQSYNSSTKKGTEIKSSTKCYRSGTPSISSIRFVPNESFSGVVSIGYTAYDANGASYRGTVNITVGASAMTSILYSTERNAPVSFDAADFDAVSVAATGYHVRSVRFTLPSSSVGTVYYKYKSATSVGTKASMYTNYNRTSSPMIDDLTFVPAKDYGGTVNIAYVATDINGTTFAGVVTVDVSGVAGTVTYTTYYNTPLTFSVNAFNDVCVDRFGENLRYVTFTLPSETRGILYSDYRSINDYGTRVRTDTQYYRTSAPLISSITFVPASGFSGAAVFDFEGCSVSGRTFAGTVSITVRPSTLPFTDMSSYRWAEEAVAYLYGDGVVNGVTDTEFAPGRSISRGDFALMLYRAYDLAPQGTESFSDVSNDAYYAGAVRTLKSLGIVRGDDVGRFRPTDSLTRQDAMVMMLRAMRTVGGWFVEEGTEIDVSGFTDRSDIASYAVGAVGALTKLNVIRGSGNGALFPLQALTRAEMAVILHRVLTL
ncbi:MAG: S-layer homology domain-containing protein [Oscillospiraceae bacterium]|nr:S-layer homology domain-containing protein [Oscillospiraceae bacterium]